MNKFILLMVLAGFMSASTIISTKQNQWTLVGTPVDIIDVENIDLHDGDAIWMYDNNSWSCYRKGNYDLSQICTEFTSINSGDGFWIWSREDHNITLNGDIRTEKDIISNTWTLISPVNSDINVSSIFEIPESNASYIWGYEDANWTRWRKDEEIGDFQPILTLKKGHGYWVMAESGDFYPYKALIGNDSVFINNGDFGIVNKSSNDEVEDIWNINLHVQRQNENPFNIGMRITKENGAFGDIIFYNVKILNNGTLVNPNKISVFGRNSVGTEGGLTLNQTVQENSLEYNNGKLLIKLGYIMKNQGTISESSFTSLSLYDLNIRIDNSISFKNNILLDQIYLYDEFKFQSILFSESSSVIYGKINIE